MSSSPSAPAAAAAGAPSSASAKSAVNGKSRCWCWTLNNPPRDVATFIAGLPESVRFAVAQLERGAEGTLHVQGYIAFKNATTMGGCKKIVGERAHVEAARADEKANIAYCTKASTRVEGPWEFGHAKQPGKRSDLAEAAEIVKKSGSLRDVDPVAIVKFGRGLRDLAAMNKVPFRSVNVVFCGGPTGIGKTYMLCGPGPVFKPEQVYKLSYSNGGNTWFDGYDGEPVLVIDEFAGQIPLPKLLQMLDGYSLSVEIKGGRVQARWTTVIITSNLEPVEWYPAVKDKHPEHYDALMRRIGGAYSGGDGPVAQSKLYFWAKNRAELVKYWSEAVLAVPAIIPVPPDDMEHVATPVLVFDQAPAPAPSPSTSPHLKRAKADVGIPVYDLDLDN